VCRNIGLGGHHRAGEMTFNANGQNHPKVPAARVLCYTVLTRPDADSAAIGTGRFRMDSDGIRLLQEQRAKIAITHARRLIATKTGKPTTYETDGRSQHKISCAGRSIAFTHCDSSKQIFDAFFR
jgi:hypothetical protein